MKILSADQLKEADLYTIRKEPIASIDLMERASLALTGWFAQRFRPGPAVKIFCGTGNNGGDGLAIARLLKIRAFDVSTWVVGDPQKGSPDFRANLERLQQQALVGFISQAGDIPPMAAGDILIDALFGTGLSRPVSGIFREVIAAINAAGAKVVAVDMPSGLYADRPNGEDAIVKATETVSFQTPKLAFFLPDNEAFVGHWSLVPIGLDAGCLQRMEASHIFFNADEVKSRLRKRSRFSHKGTFGHALLLAGSYGKMGAALLCCRACLTTGAGLVTAYVPACGYEIVQTGLPECMAETDPSSLHISEVPELEAYRAIGIGPGIGKAAATWAALKILLGKARVPLVLDADALNLLAAHPEALSSLPAGCVLTPHPGEFQRLAGKWTNDYEKLDKLRAFSRKYNCTVVLKGAHTAVCEPGGLLYFNSTGNPGMATAGSGDVLTGIITSLLAQGYGPSEAALLGVFLHGYAGDKAAASLSMASLTASDITRHIFHFFRDFEERS